MENPQILTTSSSGRRRSSATNSPEFEFWKVRNPSFPEPNLHSADELFSDGVLLPLDLLHHHHTYSNDPPPETPEPPTTTAGEAASISEANDLSNPPPFTASKRWKDIFRKSADQKKISGGKEEKKKKERKSGGGGASAAELNINLWPFSRSRSAGTGGTRPRIATAARKVSSAPCSRSNSAGESKSRKWPSSPSRGAGVHLGRTSPVWQIRRVGSGRNTVDPAARNSTEKSQKSKKTAAAVDSGGGGKGKVLNVNVPACIGYRHHLSCRSDENGAVRVAGAVNPGVGGAVDSGRGGNLFSFRGLFTKKVY